MKSSIAYSSSFSKRNLIFKGLSFPLSSLASLFMPQHVLEVTKRKLCVSTQAPGFIRRLKMQINSGFFISQLRFQIRSRVQRPLWCKVDRSSLGTRNHGIIIDFRHSIKWIIWVIEKRINIMAFDFLIYNLNDHFFLTDKWWRKRCISIKSLRFFVFEF